MYKNSKKVFVLLAIAFTFIITVSPRNISASTLVVSESISRESSIQSHTAPRSIRHIVVENVYRGNLRYIEVHAHGTLYKGYLSHYRTEFNTHIYAGTLYRHDLPQHPIPINGL